MDLNEKAMAEEMPSKKHGKRKRYIAMALIGVLLFAASAAMTGLYIHAKLSKANAEERVYKKGNYTSERQEKPTESQPHNPQAIVVSFPGKRERKYYKKSLHDIAAFFRELDQKTEIGGDELFIIHDNTAKELDEYNFTHARFIKVRTGNDLWMRDFFTAVPDNPVKFIYRPDYLEKSVAKETDKLAKKFIRKLKCQEDVTWSSLVVDGGNVVENGKDKAIVSKRVLRENLGMSPAEVKHKLEEALDRQVALVPDPDDKTGHSDGFVSFIEENSLLLGDFGDEVFYNEVKEAILHEFPGLKIIPLPSYEIEEEFDGFASAEGMYSNALVTYSNIYVPMFKKEDYNERAFNTFKENTDKKVLTVDTSELGYMGGNVRCMTWQVDAKHPIAKALHTLAEKEEKSNASKV